MLKMEAFDYRKRGPAETEAIKSKGEYSFRPREIESVYSADSLDTEFDILFDKLPLCKTEVAKNSLISLMGTLVGEYINAEAKATPASGLDIGGEIRGLADMQGFLERELITRGSSVASFFRDPIFLSAVNAEVDFAEAEKINEYLRGAESVHAFVDSISKQEKVIFIGSEVNLDTRHAIDLVIGMSDDPKAEHPAFDEISLVQVKTNMPTKETIDKILTKHKAYAEALEQLEGLAVGEKEEEFLNEDGTIDTEAYKAKMESIDLFYRQLIMPAMKMEPTWESLVELANTCNCDPVLMYIRINKINETRTNSFLPYQRNVLNMLKAKAGAIKVPQDQFANYNRLKRGGNHISSAKKISSIVVAEGKIISKKQLL